MKWTHVVAFLSVIFVALILGVNAADVEQQKAGTGADVTQKKASKVKKNKAESATTSVVRLVKEDTGNQAENEVEPASSKSAVTLPATVEPKEENEVADEKEDGGTSNRNPGETVEEGEGGGEQQPPAAPAKTRRRPIVKGPTFSEISLAEKFQITLTLVMFALFVSMRFVDIFAWVPVGVSRRIEQWLALPPPRGANVVRPKDGQQGPARRRTRRKKVRGRRSVTGGRQVSFGSAARGNGIDELLGTATYWDDLEALVSSDPTSCFTLLMCDVERANEKYSALNEEFNKEENGVLDDGVDDEMAPYPNGRCSEARERCHFRFGRMAEFVRDQMNNFG